MAASQAPGGVSVTVSDTGPGIESEMERHLFDRFWKGHADGTRGAGLGLAIVDGILQAHGTRDSCGNRGRPGERLFLYSPDWGLKPNNSQEFRTTEA